MLPAMAEGTRVLVTGASGFIATHIVQQLQQQSYQVRGTVRSKSNEEKVKPLHTLCPDAMYPLELVEADLTKAEDWIDAVKDCTFVMHVATSVPEYEPSDPQDVIRPAVEGTLNVLRACKEAGCVKKLVLTSSIAAVVGNDASKAGTPYNENDWSDVEACTMAYYRSKTLAEKAAWNFVAELPQEDKFEIVAINPSFVMGPVLCGSFRLSMKGISLLMNNPS